MIRLLTAALCVLSASCAETSVSINGKQVFRTQANCTSLTFRQGSTSLTMTGVNHSDATRAGGSVLGTATAGAAGIIMAVATKGLMHP